MFLFIENPKPEKKKMKLLYSSDFHRESETRKKNKKKKKKRLNPIGILQSELLRLFEIKDTKNQKIYVYRHKSEKNHTTELKLTSENELSESINNFYLFREANIFLPGTGTKQNGKYRGSHYFPGKL